MLELEIISSSTNLNDALSPNLLKKAAGLIEIVRLIHSDYLWLSGNIFSI